MSLENSEKCLENSEKCLENSETLLFFDNEDQLQRKNVQCFRGTDFIDLESMIYHQVNKKLEKTFTSSIDKTYNATDEVNDHANCLFHEVLSFYEKNRGECLEIFQRKCIHETMMAHHTENTLHLQKKISPDIEKNVKMLKKNYICHENKIIHYRNDCDVSIIDLINGTGKSDVALLAGLLYYLLDKQNLQEDFSQRCHLFPSPFVNQVHNLMFKNIIAVSCPLYLMDHWENTITQFISIFNSNRNEFHNKSFMTHYFGLQFEFKIVKNTKKLKQEDFENPNVIYFLLLYPSSNYKNNTGLVIKSFDNQEYHVAHPILIIDDIQHQKSAFFLPYDSSDSFAYPCHVIGLCNNINYLKILNQINNNNKINSQMVLHKRVLGIDWSTTRVNLENDHVMAERLLLLLHYCRTSPSYVDHIENQLGNIRIHHLHLNIQNSTFSDNASQFQSCIANFEDLQQDVSTIQGSVVLPSEFQFGFCLSEYLQVFQHQIDTLKLSEKKGLINTNAQVNTANIVGSVDGGRQTRNQTGENIKKIEALEHHITLKKNKLHQPICFCMDELHIPRPSKRQCIRIDSELESETESESEKNQEIVILNCCSSLFHKNCLQQWIDQGNHTCPNCRKDNLKMIHCLKINSSEKQVMMKKRKKAMNAGKRRDSIEHAGFRNLVQFIQNNPFHSDIGETNYNNLSLTYQNRIRQVIESLCVYIKKFKRSLNFIIIFDSNTVDEMYTTNELQNMIQEAFYFFQNEVALHISSHNCSKKNNMEAYHNFESHYNNNTKSTKTSLNVLIETISRTENEQTRGINLPFVHGYIFICDEMQSKNDMNTYISRSIRLRKSKQVKEFDRDLLLFTIAKKNPFS